MKTFNTSTYHNTVVAPSSKSYLQRAIAIASFIEKEVVIDGFYPSDDANVALEIAKNLGRDVVVENNRLRFLPQKESIKQVNIHVGEAGLSTRMFAPILALQGINVTMNGSGSILSRPQHMIVDALKQLGVKHTSNEGYLPISFSGESNNLKLEIDGSISSQLLTGLLIGMAVSGKGGKIVVNNLKSKPYIDMTISILNHFGFEVKNDNYTYFEIEAKQEATVFEYRVEGDWSGASFHAIAGAISKGVHIKNLNLNSAQSDIVLLYLLKKVGSKIERGNNEIKISKGDLHAFEFDLTEAPDLFPPVAVLGLACFGISKIKGLHRLKHKESDRGVVLQKEFEKLEGRIELVGDEMWIHGKGYLEEGRIDSNNDHRIAMAGAIASLICEGEIELTNEWAINKSYPTFYDDFLKGG